MPPDLRARLGEAQIDDYLDALNRDLLDRLQRGGEAFVSNAVVNGRYVLRACIVNFHTTQADVEAQPRSLRESDDWCIPPADMTHFIRTD